MVLVEAQWKQFVFSIVSADMRSKPLVFSMVPVEI
jgi:hypothetical protein